MSHFYRKLKEQVLNKQSHLRESKSVFLAPSAVVAGVVAARLAPCKIPGAASALSEHVDAHSNQRCFVCVHHVRQTADFQGVGAAALARLVLIQALVNSHHRNVDSNIFLNLIKHQVNTFVNPKLLVTKNKFHYILTKFK